jgi:hypothetical protein
VLTVADKPSTASGYEAIFAETVRRGCLTLITAAYDLREHLVVVGGLVPGLIEIPPEGALPHVGTRDLDLGLEVAILDDGFYQGLTTRLRAAGFRADEENGRLILQRWRLDHEGLRLTVDFLMEPTEQKSD